MKIAIMPIDNMAL